MLVICCLVCIEQPRYRKDERQVVEEPALISTDDHLYRVEVIDISAGGVLIRGNVPEPTGTRVMISVGDLRLPAVLIRKGADQIALKLEGDAARTAMIHHIHSADHAPAPLEVGGSDVAVKVIQRVFR